MRDAGVNIAAIFSPEHGFLGKEDRPGIQDTVDPATGIKIFSLYGATKRPTPEMLQRHRRAGVRHSGRRRPLLHLRDHHGVRAWRRPPRRGFRTTCWTGPNPITGTRVEGPMLDAANQIFVGYFAGEPVRHGMTMGELAQDVQRRKQDRRQADRDPDAGLAARRLVRFHQSPWINPSPNMRSLNAAMLYPGPLPAGVFQEFFGGPRHRCAVRTGRRRFHRRPRTGALTSTSARFPACASIPRASRPPNRSSRACSIEGVRFVITNRELLDATRLGLELAAAIAEAVSRQDRFHAWASADRQRRRDPPPARQAKIRAPSRSHFQDAVKQFVEHACEISVATSAG